MQETTSKSAEPDQFGLPDRTEDFCLSCASYSISVIIASHNYGQYLPFALESIQSQTHPVDEIIVIDDGSTDDTAQVVKQLDGVRYIYQKKQGASAARNSGVRHSSSNLIAFLDADDLWTENKIKLQLSAFESNENIDMVFGHTKEFYSKELADEQRSARLREYIPGYICSTMLIKKERFLAVGDFSSETKVGEFIDWLMRAKEVGLNSVLLPEVLHERRVHLANTAVDGEKSYTDFAFIIKKALDRRRASKS